MEPRKESSTIEQTHRQMIASEIISAYLQKNPVDLDMIPNVIKSITRAANIIFETPVQNDALTAAGISLHSSFDNLDMSDIKAVRMATVMDDAIVCLIDGKKLKTMKRYLRSHYDISPEEYRRAFGLPVDYPMVAPAYSRQRSKFAKKIGLGTSDSRKSEDLSSASDPESDSLLFNGNELPEGLNATSIEDTYTDDYIVCLEDGNHVKTLKRYLRSRFDMTVDEYLTKWGLPKTYPTVAPATSRDMSNAKKKDHAASKAA